MQILSLVLVVSKENETILIYVYIYKQLPEVCTLGIGTIIYGNPPLLKVYQELMSR